MSQSVPSEEKNVKNIEPEIWNLFQYLDPNGF